MKSLHEVLQGSTTAEHSTHLSEEKSEHDKLLVFYNEELSSLQNEAHHFAQKHPEVAQSLGIHENSINDPLMNHLLQSFAFMSARLQHQFSLSQNKLIRSLLKVMAPQLEHPYPAMSIAQFSCKSNENNLGSIPKGTPIILKTKSQRSCEFITAYSLNLISAEITELSYRSFDNGSLIRLELTKTKSINNAIRFYINLPMNLALKLHTHFLEKITHIHLYSGDTEFDLSPALITAVGFKDDESVLDYPAHLLNSHKLCNEFFNYPTRFLFFDVDLSDQKIEDNRPIQFDFYFSCYESLLSTSLSEKSLLLNCAPIINIYKQMAEAIVVRNSNVSIHPLRINNNSRNPQMVTSIETVQALDNNDDEFKLYPLFYTEFGSPSKTQNMHWELERSAAASENLNESYELKIYSAGKTLKLIHAEVYCCDQNTPKELFSSEAHSLIFKHSSFANSLSISCITEPSEYRSSLINSNTVIKLAQCLNLNYLLPNKECLNKILEIIKIYNQRTHPSLDFLVNSISGLKASKESFRNLDSTINFKRFVMIQLNKNCCNSFYLMKKLIQAILDDYSFLDTQVVTEYEDSRAV